MDCGGKRSATPLWIGPVVWLSVQKRRRRCALPAQSKKHLMREPHAELREAHTLFV